MAKIHAPNKQYCGVSASVTFVNGVGETADPHLIEWFKSKGYKVEVSSLDEMNVDELKEYAEKKGIDIGQSTSQKGILKKIQEAEKPKDEPE